MEHRHRVGLVLHVIGCRLRWPLMLMLFLGRHRCGRLTLRYRCLCLYARSAGRQSSHY
jgi:hypothetical protein